MSVRGQLGSMEVLQILHRLDHAHSTYTDAFTNIHRDIAKVQYMCNYTHIVRVHVLTSHARPLKTCTWTDVLLSEHIMIIIIISIIHVCTCMYDCVCCYIFRLSMILN